MRYAGSAQLNWRIMQTPPIGLNALCGLRSSELAEDELLGLNELCGLRPSERACKLHPWGTRDWSNRSEIKD